MGVSKRKLETRRLTHEAMREKISFAHTLNDIVEAEAKLKEWVEREEPPSNGHIGAIRTLLDSKWKKLNKLLPDLKAVDYTGTVDAGNNLLAMLEGMIKPSTGIPGEDED